MAKVTITAEAKQHLLAKGTNELRVQHAECGGWGGPVIRPAVLAGAPTNSQGYQQQNINGIEVYVHEDLKVQPEGITIALGGWGPFRFVTLTGAV